jgi:hypothetical protein
MYYSDEDAHKYVITVKLTYQIEDYPCEMCGPSFDSMNITRISNDEWNITWNFGCTGYVDKVGDLQEVERFLKNDTRGEVAEKITPLMKRVAALLVSTD